VLGGHYTSVPRGIRYPEYLWVKYYNGISVHLQTFFARVKKYQQVALRALRQQAQRRWSEARQATPGGLLRHVPGPRHGAGTGWRGRICRRRPPPARPRASLWRGRGPGPRRGRSARQRALAPTIGGARQQRRRRGLTSTRPNPPPTTGSATVLAGSATGGQIHACGGRIWRPAATAVRIRRPVVREVAMSSAGLWMGSLGLPTGFFFFF